MAEGTPLELIAVEVRADLAQLERGMNGAVFSRMDEAKDFLTPQLFSTFESAIHTYKCDYLAMHARNLLAPLLEAWDVDVKFLMIAGLLNADQNPQLFKTKISDKIFNRYEVQYHYNKLLPKLFYDAEVKITKVKVSVQG
jgi:hypothetical protein